MFSFFLRQNKRDKEEQKFLNIPLELHYPKWLSLSYDFCVRGKVRCVCLCRFCHSPSFLLSLLLLQNAKGGWIFTFSFGVCGKPRCPGARIFIFFMPLSPLCVFSFIPHASGKSHEEGGGVESVKNNCPLSPVLIWRPNAARTTSNFLLFFLARNFISRPRTISSPPPPPFSLSDMWEKASRRLEIWKKKPSWDGLTSQLDKGKKGGGADLKSRQKHSPFSPFQIWECHTPQLNV